MAKSSSSSLGALARFGRGKRAAEKAQQSAAEKAAAAAAARVEAQKKRDDARFIDEVSEELQRERMMAAARRYGPFAIGGLVLIIAVVGGLEYQDAARQDAARAFGGELIAATRQDDPTQRLAALEQVAAAADSAQTQAVAQLYAADAALAADDPDRAREIYDAVASAPDIAPLYRDLAIFKATLIDAETLALDALVARLDPLTEFDAPYRTLALEQIGLAQARAGRHEQARATLAEAVADRLATPFLQQRVRLTLETLPAPQTEAGDEDGAGAPAGEDAATAPAGASDATE